MTDGEIVAWMQDAEWNNGDVRLLRAFVPRLCEALKQKQELPPGGKWLTREQVEKVAFLCNLCGVKSAHNYQSRDQAKADYLKVMDELFGEDDK